MSFPRKFIKTKVSYFHVSTSLVSQLHDEFWRTFSGRIEQAVHNVEIHRSAKIVDVGDEAKLSTLVNELSQQPRVVERIVKIAVTGWVPPKAQSSNNNPNTPF